VEAAAAAGVAGAAAAAAAGVEGRAVLRDRLVFGRKANTFTLQWHVTNACESHCRHCYDRTARPALDLKVARRVVENLQAFCRRRRVRGQVCLTGGNPLLYPGFFDLYQALTHANFRISLLGNPATAAELDRLLAIQRPAYYQISLEGMEVHNDHIRGSGHFARAVGFLDVLREAHVRSVVMLTLTQDNLDQVIPLGQYLRGRVDRLTFNRLSAVGEGSALRLPTRAAYGRFMREYLKASKTNPILGFKDNLFSIFRYRYGRPLMRGCTGFGCGAAFNFVALLPDGEVHACRKFPSLLGDIQEADLSEIYDSPLATRYRRGCQECRPCPVRNVCGGCLAVAYGHGLDIFRQRDPHCFMDLQELPMWKRVPFPRLLGRRESHAA
jgi:selenobiotic family peptide radical SAM maturase